MRERPEPDKRRAMTPKRRAEVFEKCQGRCAGCGHKIKPGEPWEADHEISLFSGGKDDLSNLVVRCVPCHRGEKTPQDAKVHAKIRRIHKRIDGTEKPKKKIHNRGFDKRKRKFPTRRPDSV